MLVGSHLVCEKTKPLDAHETVLQGDVKKELRHVGIARQTRCHSCQRSFAAQLWEGGCNIRTVRARVLGNGPEQCENHDDLYPFRRPWGRWAFTAPLVCGEGTTQGFMPTRIRRQDNNVDATQELHVAMVTTETMLVCQRVMRR
jgi:hypothetical protein